MSADAALERDRIARIRKLNDHLRVHFGGGKVMLSAGVDALSHDFKAAALMELRKFSDFNKDNDPYGEHDFGSFEVGHYRFIWKISYYDPSYEFHSEDPADHEKTRRVLTLMLAEEY